MLNQNSNQSLDLLQILQGIESRLGSKIETTTSSVNEMRNEISGLHLKYDKIDKQVKNNREKIQDCEESVDAVSSLFDCAQNDNDTMRGEMKSLKREMESLKRENDNLREKQSASDEKILDLQCRSMRDNLIFFGIEESSNTKPPLDQAERDLEEFLDKEMNIEKKIEFHRVHRLGRRRRDQLNPRPIIAKFVNFKEREEIRYQASDKLTGTTYGIVEQYPREIEDRRKPLYEVVKKAKEEGHRARLIKDKLYINNELQNQYHGNQDRPNYNKKSNYTGNHNRSSAHTNNYNRSSYMNGARVFYRTIGNKMKTVLPKTSRRPTDTKH